MDRGARNRFFRRILGYDLKDHTKCTRYYAEVDFCIEKLHMLPSEYKKISSQERKMLEVYLDIKDKGTEKQMSEMEEKQTKTTKGYK